MSNLCISAMIDTSDLIRYLLEDFDYLEMSEFIQDLDDAVGDWDFTRAMYDYFAAEMEKIKE